MITFSEHSTCHYIPKTLVRHSYDWPQYSITAEKTTQRHKSRPGYKKVLFIAANFNVFTVYNIYQDTYLSLFILGLYRGRLFGRGAYSREGNDLIFSILVAIKF